MEFIKKNFTLLIAFSLPILLIGMVVLFVYVPTLFISTPYNFIYVTCDSSDYYDCENYLQKKYSVVDTKLVVRDVEMDINDDEIIDDNQAYLTHIFLHDTEKNESREISLEEAQTLSINSLLTSPDGFTVSNNFNNTVDIFPFFAGGYSSFEYYLTKDNKRIKMNLVSDTYRAYYAKNFRFVGWILSDRK
jgi:hypothetical protein